MRRHPLELGSDRVQEFALLEVLGPRAAFSADASLPDDAHTRTLRQNAATLTYPRVGQIEAMDIDEDGEPL